MHSWIKHFLTLIHAHMHSCIRTSMQPSMYPCRHADMHLPIRLFIHLSHTDRQTARPPTDRQTYTHLATYTQFRTCIHQGSVLTHAPMQFQASSWVRTPFFQNEFGMCCQKRLFLSVLSIEVWNRRIQPQSCGYDLKLGLSETRHILAAFLGRENEAFVR